MPIKIGYLAKIVNKSGRKEQIAYFDAVPTISWLKTTDTTKQQPARFV
jgi:hypothetical protein